MSDFLNGLAGNLLRIGESLLPMIVPGAGPVIAAAKEAAGALGKIKAIEGISDPAALEAMQGQLEAAVFAHADRTLDSLV